MSDDGNSAPTTLRYLPDWNPYRDVTFLLCDTLQRDFEQRFPSMKHYNVATQQLYYPTGHDPTTIYRTEYNRCSAIRTIAERDEAKANQLAQQLEQQHVQQQYALLRSNHASNLWSLRKQPAHVIPFERDEAESITLCAQQHQG